MHSVASQCGPINLILHSKSLQQIYRRSNIVALHHRVNFVIFSLGGLHGPRPFLFVFLCCFSVVVLVCVCRPYLLFTTPLLNYCKAKTKVIWAPRGSAKLEIYLQSEISHTLLHLAGTKKNKKSRLLQLSESV